MNGTGAAAPHVDQHVLEQALLRADYLRRSPFALGGAGGHKEWLHFCVYGADIDLLVNFSVCDDVRSDALRGTEFARVTVLVREGAHGWDGEVELYDTDSTVIRGGSIHMVFGANEVCFRDGEYHILVSLRDRAIQIELRLRPLTVPSLANNVQLDPGPPINWLVMPRLEANGFAMVAGRRYPFCNAPAYHDHNWGHFAWGRDFAWEWGFGLPHDAANPWSMVFVRLSDRAHTKSLLQVLLLWKGPRQCRVLRGHEVAIQRSGYLRPERIVKLPRPMALISPDLLPDVPRQLVVRGEADGDQLECVFDAQDVAQVIIPNDQNFGVTIINEVSGTIHVRGMVRGEDVAMSGRAIFEFLGA